jgi:hypothetical protein
MGWPPELDYCKHNQPQGFCDRCAENRRAAEQARAKREQNKKKGKSCMVLNLTKEEAVELRTLLKDERGRIALAKHHRAFPKTPLGRVLTKVNKLLGLRR